MGGFVTEILPALFILLALLIQLQVIILTVKHHTNEVIKRVDEIDAQQRALLRPRVQVEP